MEPSSRTPEGERNRCPVCGKTARIDPSRPPGDAPCPHCGHLLWFEPPEIERREVEPATEESSVLELVELAQPSRNQKELAEQESRLRQGEFTLSDLKRIIDRMRAVRGVGGAAKTLEEMNPEADFRKVTGIIDSMTPEERRNPSNTVNLSRRQRIAVGAGVEPHEVSELVRHFQGLSEMMKKLASMRY